MQGGMPTPDLSPIHKLLSEHAVPDDLVVVRLSARAKRLIFKSSVKKGVEIVVPHGAASSWVVEMTENRIPWIRSAQLPWLTSLAEDRGLSFNRTFVKNQVSLWGSCSKKRNINLNRNLLFLPKHLVEYVLHHELTHLEHLNHSGRFWSTFTRVLPDCRELRREMRSLNPDDMPLWASPGLDSV
jgi:predicted metal-dependent hydrolase